MKLFHCLCCFVFVVICPALQAAYLYQDGKFIDKNEAATLSVQEHYSLAMDAYQNKDWKELVRQSIIVTKNFPGTAFAENATFYLGVGYFELEEYDFANAEFSQYLKKQATPKYFEEAIQYKFSIAEKFKEGWKKHLMGWKSMPKWMPAREEALAIYDEVITALPHHDLSAQALFGKGRLFFKDEDYKLAIDAYQTLILRFPKHHLAPESYIGISEVYLTQSQEQYPDPDFLDLAEINLKKFRHDFPGEERLEITEKMFRDMQEIYARNLYETGRFFERTKKKQASVIYYSKVIRKYPNTKVAELSKKRLESLEPSRKTQEKKQ